MTKILKTNAISLQHYDKCPKCCSTDIDCEGSIWYCYDCQKDFKK